ncbi:hypothetical protein KC325_g89 [Hortaea werneckii]|nr:hypothetical protein KC325_g89 [Hortaea werneckii]
MRLCIRSTILCYSNPITKRRKEQEVPSSVRSLSAAALENSFMSERRWLHSDGGGGGGWASPFSCCCSSLLLSIPSVLLGAGLWKEDRWLCLFGKFLADFFLLRGERRKRYP